MNDDRHRRPPGGPAEQCDGQLMLPGLEHLPPAPEPAPAQTGPVHGPDSHRRRGPRSGQVRAPLGVWCTAQSTSRFQRTGRYLPESIAHPGRMLPSIARRIIEAYTEPHDLVLDPMCGIGTSVIEAMHLGRNAIGIEYERRWAHLTQRGVNHARTQGACGAGYVWNTDARTVPEELLHAAAGRVKLLVTSPPYGPTCHGQVKVAGRSGHTGAVAKVDASYSADRRNLAHRPARELLAGFTDILAAARPLLAPGGIVAVTARPWRRGGHLIDLPSAVLRAGRTAGYTPLERCVALLARCEQTRPDQAPGCDCTPAPSERLIAHGWFFQLDAAHRANIRGIPQSLITHEDVCVLTLEEM